MTASTAPLAPGSATLLARVVPLRAFGGSASVIERNLRVYRRGWLIVVSGFFEPLFYLLSIGLGLGKLVGDVNVAGHLVPYRTFVAPAMLAASSMNTAIAETVFNVFHKLRYAKIYGAILATPVSSRDVAVGEVGWSLMRGGAYSVMFLIVMAALHLVTSWWALLALPASLLLGASFSAAGMALATFMRGFQDFEYVGLVELPLFLFSATFYPLSTYPGAIQAIVRLTPLYQGVALLRALTTGSVSYAMFAHVGYLLVLLVVGITVAGRRLDKLLLR